MKAVALDLDGTLLNKEHKVSTLSKSVLQNLVNKGIFVVLASARPMRSVLDIAHDVGLSNKPMIGGNGAIIAKSPQDILYRNSIQRTELNQIVNCFNQFNESQAGSALTLHLYSDLTWYVPSMTFKAKEEAQIIGFEPDVVGNEAFELQKAEKVMIVGEPKQLLRFAEHIYKLNLQVNAVLSKPDSLEINALGVSKSTGVQEVAKLLKLTIKDFICMGDGDNDAEMLRNCGLGVAMENASALAKSSAKQITLSNNKDGVALFLKEYFSL